jgi:predicted methyltransferase
MHGEAVNIKTMEKNKMKNEKKQLIKKFKVVLKDLLDNYDEYTDAEKAQVKELFEKAADMNTILDKYDIEVKFDWKEYMSAYGNYFDEMH